MLWVLGIFIWVVLAFWPAMLARRKGYSFILFLLLSWLISWLLALIVVLFLKDKNVTAEDREADKAVEKIKEQELGE